MKIDLRSTQIAPETIGKIQESILYFTDEMSQILQILERNGSLEDRKWAIILAKSFSEDLSFWLQRHAQELMLIKAQTQAKSRNIDDIQNKRVLELSAKNLEVRIGAIEKLPSTSRV
jgi:hypothetical protein